MKKLIILLISIMISFNSYAGTCQIDGKFNGYDTISTIQFMDTMPY